jgi:hypothetical protein
VLRGSGKHSSPRIVNLVRRGVAAAPANAADRVDLAIEHGGRQRPRGVGRAASRRQRSLAGSYSCTSSVGVQPSTKPPTT